MEFLNKERSIQDYLSLGYLFLLFLGIISDSIFYGFLGINIIRYSTIMDVLLSPIHHLTKDWILPAMMLGVFLLIYFLDSYQSKKHQENSKKESYRNKKNFAALEKQFDEKNKLSKMLVYTFFIVFGIYTGIGIGGGGKVKNFLKKGGYEMNHTITFVDEKQLPVRVVGQNSGFVFYLKENAKTVTISPIQGNIKSIEKIIKE